MTPGPGGTQYEWARRYRRRGLSVIPVKADASKSPAFDGWRAFSDRLATDAELERWWLGRTAYGIGLTGGPAGQVVFPDFETAEAFDTWLGLIPEALRAKVESSPLVATPGGGRHVYARCGSDTPAGKVYARRPDKKTLIEMRGRGQQVVAPGSPARCHLTGQRYEFLRLGWLTLEATPPNALWTPADFAAAAAAMRALDRCPRTVVGVPKNRTPVTTPGDRPGDRFNHRAEWEAILKPHGWRPFKATGETVYWTRPGKASGVSATTGYCQSDGSGDLLYVFSSSALPFEPETAYSRFGAYAVLEHRGDFTAAARALSAAGYGGPRVSILIGGKAVR